MSYILNALRKSEKERQATQPETVTDRILAQQPDRNRRTVKWVVIAVLGNVLIIGGLIGYFRTEPDTPALHQLSKEPPIKKTGEKATDKPLTETAESAKLLERLPAPVSAKLAEKEQIAAYKQPENQLEALSKKAAPPAITAKKSPPAKLNPPQAEEIKPTPAPVSIVGIPFLKELSYEFRQSVPKMVINVFVYSSEPAERFVMINMVKYKTGQQTKDEVDINEIRQDSLVVNYRNQTFRIERP